VSVYNVLFARLLAGVKVALFPVPEYATTPGTAVVPGPARVKVLLVMVRGSIALLKTAVTTVFTATPVALQAGFVESTVGGVVSGAIAVVKLHEKLLAIAAPDRSRTPVVTVTVMSVLAGRLALGAKVAMLLNEAYVMAPRMGVVPGPVTMKLAAVMVVGSIASLKVTAIF